MGSPAEGDSLVGEGIRPVVGCRDRECHHKERVGKGSLEEGSLEEGSLGVAVGCSNRCCQTCCTLSVDVMEEMEIGKFKLTAV